MKADWAAENLQTIRTLMERSAVYRRALGPLLAVIGGVGIAAAIVGSRLGFSTPRDFIGFWVLVSLVGLVAAFLIIRRQALAAAEPFWSSPTRRVVHAILPPFCAGLVAAIVLVVLGPANPIPVTLIVPLWMILYGCALHAAGFFMPRGFRLFGWCFVLFGCAIATVGLAEPQWASLVQANWVMGAFFGGAHLAYSVYLFMTEKSKGLA